MAKHTTDAVHVTYWWFAGHHWRKSPETHQYLRNNSTALLLFGSCFYSLLTNAPDCCPHCVSPSFFPSPAGHSVSYLEYMTHMAADHWQKGRGEQFLYE